MPWLKLEIVDLDNKQNLNTATYKRDIIKAQKGKGKRDYMQAVIKNRSNIYIIRQDRL